MNNVKVRKYISRCRKNIPNFTFPLKQSENSQIWGVIVNGDLTSILHIVLKDDYLLLNYTYTYPDYRRRGYSELLRTKAIEYAKEMGKTRVISVPFPGAHSESLLRKMGFEKEDEHYYLNI